MADILIRGMEMPLRCINCPFEMFIHGENRCRANFGKRIEFEIGNDRGTNCPLVPLPEGHGDLIDRDAFRAENGLNAKCEHCPTNTYECQNDMIHTKMDFCGMLDDAPVIVPAEGGGEDGD